MLSQTTVPIGVTICAEEWLAPDADLLSFDSAIHEAEDAAGASRRVGLRVVGEGVEGLRTAEAQVWLRYQRLAPRRNKFSKSPLFTALFAEHKALHVLTKPMVRAVYDHAVDVWQWILRLSPGASMELQVAALFHDIERLESEADRRVEHTVADYLRFEASPAMRGAAIARDVLTPLAISPRSLARIQQLVSSRGQPRPDAELAVLNDADSLSFFALNCPVLVGYFEAGHIAKNVAHTLSRMSPCARAWLKYIRLDSRVATLLDQATCE